MYISSLEHVCCHPRRASPHPSTASHTPLYALDTVNTPFTLALMEGRLVPRGDNGPAHLKK